MPRNITPAPERFARFVKKDDSADGCWEFDGAQMNEYGHRAFAISTGKAVLAHRYAWSLEHGDAGEMCVLHQCDNPACVRPSHLFLGTRADNNADMDRKGRRVPHVGESHPHAKLTEAKVREIRELRRTESLTYHQLARRFGVAVTTIQAVIEGRTWKLA